VKKDTFIYGYYGLSNLGDDLLILSIITRLQKSKFAEKYFIRNYGKVDILSRKENIIYTCLETHIVSKKTLFQKLSGLYFYARAHHKVFKTCHSMILGGGTLISGHSSAKSLFLIWLISLLAKINSLKVYGVGLGVAKLDTPVKRFLARCIINNCDFLGIRDDISLKQLKSVTTKECVHLTADLIFESQNLIFDKVKTTNSLAVNMIGISIVGLFLKNENKKEIVLGSLVEAIEDWVQNGIHVRLFSFQNSKNDVLCSDTLFLDEILNTFRESPMVSLVELDSSISSINSGFSSIDVLVGMRFHGAVLAAMSYKPFVGFSCDHKMSSLCDLFSMPYVDMDDLTSDWLVNASKVRIDANIYDNQLKSLTLLSGENYKFLSEQS